MGASPNPPKKSGQRPDLREGEQLKRVFEAALGVPFTSGNDVETLCNGVEIFPALLDAIESASDTIDFLTFVYWKGDIAEQVARALANAARRGVRVRVLLDALGARPMDSSLVELMEEAGVDVRWFRPLSSWQAFRKATHRTHRKVLVCDGTVGFTGGVGIAEEWEGDARNPSEWRETHFKIRGPAVLGLGAAFLGNWIEVAPLDDGDFESVPEPEESGSAQVQVVRSTAAVEWGDLATLFRTVLHVARTSVRISTPYFVPDEDTIELMVERARAGVSIEILVPGDNTDHRVAQVAGESNYERLLDAGVRIWEYQPTLNHQKILLLDQTAVVIGSGNLNHRSLIQDDEVQVVVIEPEFAEEIGALLDRDFSRGVEISPSSWQRRGLLQRVAEAVVRPFRSQM